MKNLFRNGQIVELVQTTPVVQNKFNEIDPGYKGLT